MTASGQGPCVRRQSRNRLHHLDDPRARPAAAPNNSGKDAAIEEARPKKQDRPLGSAEILVGGRVPRHHD